MSEFNLNDKGSKSGKSLNDKGSKSLFSNLLRVLAHNLECNKSGLALLVGKNGMTLWEDTTLNILSRNTNMMTTLTHGTGRKNPQPKAGPLSGLLSDDLSLVLSSPSMSDAGLELGHHNFQGDFFCYSLSEQATSNGKEDLNLLVAAQSQAVRSLLCVLGSCR